MPKLVFLFVILFASPALGQSTVDFPQEDPNRQEEISKLDSALTAFKNGRWRQVVALFDSIVTNNYFTNNQLYHAAYKSLEKLSEQSPPAEKDSLLNRSEAIYKESVDEYGKQVTDGGVDLQVYTIVEKNPQPVGGFKKYYQLINDDLRYPEAALANGVEGKVFVQFVVNSDGTVDGVKVLKSLDAACDKEAVRLIKEGPLWKPGYHQGVPVYVRMMLPISFNIKEYEKRVKGQNE